jgi:hypothetical protein
MKKYDHQLFQNYLQASLELFQKAIGEKGPSYFLYQHKARSPLFMVEALIRLVNRLIDDKEIRHSLKAVKKLEDRIGKIDEADGFLQLFGNNKKVKRAQLGHFREKRDKILQKSDAKLIDKAYYQNLFHNIISEFTINFNDRMLILKLKEIILKELEKAHHYFLKHRTRFSSIEEVHEIRRKLRWISMYAQALNGVVVLKDDKTKYKWEKEMITQADKKLKYNKLEINKQLEEHIEFNNKAFLAISHVITQLGTIKETGLQIAALASSLKDIGITGKEATRIARQQLGIRKSEKELLQEAHELMESFFVTHRIHELLIR